MLSSFDRPFRKRFCTQDSVLSKTFRRVYKRQYNFINIDAQMSKIKKNVTSIGSLCIRDPCRVASWILSITVSVFVLAILHPSQLLRRRLSVIALFSR